MSLHRGAIDPLLDMLDFCRDIELYAAARDTGDDDLERMRYLAVERLFELLGEAMRRALSHQPNLVTDLPQAQRMISMRNRLAHEYDNIDIDTIWEAADIHVSELSAQVFELLRADGILSEGI